MQSSAIPSKIQLPFASSGTKNTIPVTSQIGITPGAASYTDGFPPLTFTPLASGGVPPAGADFNGILNAITAVQQWQSAGGIFKYDSGFSTAIGGYPKGAILQSTDGATLWLNLAENNTTDPDGATPANWAPAASYGIGAVTGLTNANVTLTPAQYSRPIITLAGTLTGNVQIIFPTTNQEWRVRNNTTGSFAVTCKTSAGTGATVAQGGEEVFYGDGTNLVQRLGNTPAAGDSSKKLVTTDFLAARIGNTGSSSSRNKFINAAFKIDQINQGGSKVVVQGAALVYNIDRWYSYATGGSPTGQQVANTADQYVYQYTGAASTTAIGHGQRINANNCYDLAGNTATLSVDLANSLLTTVTWTAYYANTKNAFGSLASPTKTQISTGTFTVNSTLARYSAQIAIPSAATTGIEVVFTVGAQTSGTWQIGNAQLESGTVMTPFQQAGGGTEEAERGLIAPYVLPLAGTYFGYANGGTVMECAVAFPVRMFGVPVFAPSVAAVGTTANTSGVTATQSTQSATFSPLGLPTPAGAAVRFGAFTGLTNTTPGYVYPTSTSLPMGLLMAEIP